MSYLSRLPVTRRAEVEVRRKGLVALHARYFMGVGSKFNCPDGSVCRIHCVFWLRHFWSAPFKRTKDLVIRFTINLNTGSQPVRPRSGV